MEQAVASQQIESVRPIDAPVWWYVSDARAFIEITLAAGQKFRSIEIQRLERAGLTGVIVFLMRPGGELDMIVTPGFDYDEAWFRSNPFTSHLKFGSIVEASFRAARCEINAHVLDISIDVEDGNGRRIEVDVRHRFANASTPWFVPATRQQHPPRTMRFMLTNSFRLVPRNVSELSARIDGQPVQPDYFLLPAALAPYYNVRCGSGLVGAGLNESGTWPLVDDSDATMPHQVVAPAFTGPLSITFSHIDEKDASGRFSVVAPIGTVATGRWHSTMTADGQQFSLTDVAQNWFPGWRHPLRLALYLARRFRRRNDSWRWVATIRRIGNRRELTGQWYDA